MAKIRKGLRHSQTEKPAVPAAEVEDYAHPASGGHHVTNGYDPYRGDWNRAVFGNGRFIPDVWEGEMPPIKRPADDPHDYDYDGE